MNRLAVSCDEVFEVLTSGPFPRESRCEGSAAPCIVAQDAEIESHLAACHECRQLAEALRPAVELIDAAVQEIDADLPVYRGSLPSPVAGTLRVPSASSNPRSRSVSQPLEGFWRFAAALALGIGLLVLFQFSDAKGRRDHDSVWPPITQSADHRPSADGLAQLSSLGLPIACLLPRGKDGRHEQIETSLGRYACCVGCHSPANENRSGTRPPASAVAILASSCLACHDRP